MSCLDCNQQIKRELSPNEAFQQVMRIVESESSSLVDSSILCQEIINFHNKATDKELKIYAATQPWSEFVLKCGQQSCEFDRNCRSKFSANDIKRLREPLWGDPNVSQIS